MLTLIAVVLLTVIVPAAAGDQAPDFARALLPPGNGGLAGTDHSGYDLAIRTAEGLRISLLIAAACAVLSTAIGLIVGLSAATIGGWFDALSMRLVDGVNALPHLVVGLVIAAMWRGAPLAIIASIALTHWPAVARVVRAELLGSRSAGWIESARLAGAGRYFVARHHLLPAVTGQALVAMIVLLPHAIWHETVLSFLGVGLSPDRASLGTLLGDARGDVLTGAWWTLVVPGLALIVTALAVTRAVFVLRRVSAPPVGRVW
ncbi:ABC transporter permease [Gordonia sp. PP30]|uniref:ABC transporter permease n=1 Tax=Gordonia sp. PP30 TaxID=2935861 RepID=UPI001FFE8948|nr:ABC transporter permease [Gordonia sp. PP30]UQE73660.1 ABC transporter permease [Gordonia sp. PP30]